MIGVYAHNAGVPKVSDIYKPVRRVSMNVYKCNHYPDPDNLLKYTLDALKGTRLIVDDSAKWCYWTKPVIYPCKANEETTVISLSDVAPLPLFELRIVARPWNESGEILVKDSKRDNPSFIQRRDVYLNQREPDDLAARMPFLWHTKCPLATVREIVAWAVAVGISVVEEPTGNLSEGWTWAKHDADVRQPSLFSTDDVLAKSSF